MNNDEIDQALMDLVDQGWIHFGVNEEGEFVFWMDDKQKAMYSNYLGMYPK